MDIIGTQWRCNGDLMGIWWECHVHHFLAPSSTRWMEGAVSYGCKMWSHWPTETHEFPKHTIELASWVCWKCSIPAKYLKITFFGETWWLITQNRGTLLFICKWSKIEVTPILSVSGHTNRNGDIMGICWECKGDISFDILQYNWWE